MTELLKEPLQDISFDRVSTIKKEFFSSGIEKYHDPIMDLFCTVLEDPTHPSRPHFLPAPLPFFQKKHRETTSSVTSS